MKSETSIAETCVIKEITGYKFALKGLQILLDDRKKELERHSDVTIRKIIQVEIAEIEREIVYLGSC